MNVVLVLIDSLNRRHLTAYNDDSQVDTPNLTRFAKRACRFDNHFVGSLPCMPARREIYTGRKEMLWRPWGPIEPYDDRLPKLLETAGYTTAIVTDHYHYWENEAHGYVQSFQSAELVRGHEHDFWKSPIQAEAPVPDWVDNIERWRPGSGRRYYSNVCDFGDESDYFPARVFSSAARWLNTHAQQSRPFFLQIESFDVHEPFDVPEPYASMYGQGSERQRFTLWPPYQDAVDLDAFLQEASEEELDFIRAQYAGKLTMVDRWFGEVLDALDEQALWDKTMVIVTTDHGHDLAERGKFGKQYPHYDSHANIPLLVWHPGTLNQSPVTALTQTVDYFSTILNAAGLDSSIAPHGRSFLPLLTESSSAHREAILYGTFGQGVCCTDGEWTIFKSPETDGSLNYYSPMIYKAISDTLVDTVVPPARHGHFIPGVDMAQWQVPVEINARSLHAHARTNALYHRTDDPDQQYNLWDREPSQRERMLKILSRLMNDEGAPDEQFDRLGVPH
ncbi:sulfatase [Salinicola corii]|uniref:Sulfatase n=1 Tax=Salinicola corii TaxID=2606937 RepID=A0A640WA55_9GAMM|nr:sulfatase [Salinicola corii]KAA0016033.1 sulfatase [Salinicola corii]